MGFEPSNQALTGARRGRAEVQVGYEQTAPGSNPTRLSVSLSVVSRTRSRPFRPGRPDAGMQSAS
jgi:hypothetical protein